jgi:CopA family copper-resistance protein
MSSRRAPPSKSHSRGPVLGRRSVLGGVGASAFGGPAALAQAALTAPALSGSTFDLAVTETSVNVTGRRRSAVTVNGGFPGPTLIWREGDTVTLNVTNHLMEPTSIHWHGVRLPAGMDGVPGLSFRGIMPGETFTYRFPVTQTGTYWYHGHSGMQEQLGLHGALILRPRAGRSDPHPFDREHVVLLTDWTDEDPMTVVANLKAQGDYYDYGQRTVVDLARELKRDGLAKTWRERSMWASMRMAPTDVLDVGGATYRYLVNGRTAEANWTGLYRPGERVRLRLINASAMTLFDVRIPGLELQVIQADGCDVHPVSVDQVRIGTAETYDVIVEPRDGRAYTLFAEAMDRSGYARATLAPRPGMQGAIPPMDPRPVRTMTDMGMGSMNGMAAMADRPATAPPSSPAPSSGKMSAPATPDMSAMNMGGMAMPSADTGPATSPEVHAPPPLRPGVNVDNVAAAPKPRLGEAGDGLDGDGRRTLLYTDLRALQPAPDAREPTREVALHLTGNMQRWTWGFDGRKFSEASPITLSLGERVRFVLVNDTMMEHPIHLHGLYSELENGQGAHRPLKHTVIVKSGERLSYLVTADVPGRWAFHCHLMYHMEAGMFRTVIVD